MRELPETVEFVGLSDDLELEIQSDGGAVLHLERHAEDEEDTVITMIIEMHPHEVAALFRALDAGWQR